MFLILFLYQYRAYDVLIYMYMYMCTPRTYRAFIFIIYICIDSSQMELEHDRSFHSTNPLPHSYLQWLQTSTNSASIQYSSFNIIVHVTRGYLRDWRDDDGVRLLSSYVRHSETLSKITEDLSACIYGRARK